MKGGHRIDSIIEEEAKEGRVTPAYIAHVGDVSKSYVSQRLSLMVERDEIEKVYLAPMMLVAGDHAQNDMVGNEEDSWKNILGKEGFEVKIHLKGIGEYEEIQNMYVKKINKLMS